MKANELIESIPYMKRQLKEYHYTSASLHNAEYKLFLGDEFVSFFLSSDYGNTDKYEWKVHKVDELINLKIFAIPPYSD